MKGFIRNTAFRLTSKRIDERGLHPLHIQVPAGELCCFALSTNRILSFVSEGKRYYFRECPERLSKKAFFRRGVEDFFATLAMGGLDKDCFGQEPPIKTEFPESIVCAFNGYLEAKLEKGGLLKRLASADSIGERLGFSIWSGNTCTAAVLKGFGLEDTPEALWEIAIYFLWRMRSVAADYRRLGIAAGQGYSHFNAVRAVASRIVAEELGVAELVTDSVWCVLKPDGGRAMLGVLSEAARGRRAADIKLSPCGSLQRELMALNVLDVLTGQPDHGPNNYNVYGKAEGGYGVCSFDNDNPRTFFPSCSVKASLAGCAPLVGQDGIINRPFMDRALAERLKAVDRAALKRRLSPYLNSLQIRTIIKRLNKLNAAICRSDRLHLIDGDAWGEATVKQETGGAYGLTYLCKALTK
ncbi:MAG: hypothetical protein IKK83_00375 [Clostridia bacterium]|nr:hypothetical protein [Clostridia bacterium]